MPSSILDYQRTWADCQHYFEWAVAFDPLFGVPLRVIEWAMEHGLNQKTFAWRSHDNLVISNRRRQAQRFKKLVVIPKPESIELIFCRDGELVRKVETDAALLNEELDRFDFSRE